jgi:voltage-gated potassium channel
MHRSPLKQFRIALGIIAVLVAVGTLVYSLVWNVSLLDGLYMTVITLTTVGFRELRPPSPAVKLFTICLIVLGVGNITWAARAAAEMAVGEQFREFFGKRQLETIIARLSGHTIICGFGRMGGQIAADLARAGKPFVVIDPNPDVLDRLKESGFPYIADDATNEATLRAAGIERAANLVTVAPSDADNTFIVLCARGLNPNLFIVARSIRIQNEDKVRKAGADRVVSPYVMGGRRMAAAILNPHSVDFLEVVTGSDYSEMELAGVEITPVSSLALRRLGDADLEHNYGVTVVAMKRDGIFGMAPDRDTVLMPGDVLMIIGPAAQVGAIEHL